MYHRHVSPIPKLTIRRSSQLYSCVWPKTPTCIFPEHGPATGAGPAKEREHAAARQTEQVHGRVTPRWAAASASRHTRRNPPSEDDDDDGKTDTCSAIEEGA